MTSAQRRLIVPIVCLVLGVAMLGTTAFLTLRQRGDLSAPLPAAIGGPFALIDQDGKALTDRDLLGKPFLVFFGYTHCPDVCPTTMFELTEAFKALGPDKKITGLFVTVDPERDTAPVLKDYVSNFDPRIQAATGPRESIDRVMKTYRVYARRVPGEGEDYTMDHSAIVYIMDKQGRFVSALNTQLKPEDMAKELARYL
ncbi:SCO family protein [Roseiarcaceae bacterium H3SJ34-1]|uniref:SCO family protein n=1 Tax=Terripilifer ovatus TaxID=3032367 RepID=UPI003AB98DA0|nr:SCO family protein [Roseiarcaceae bacterium H3SJ34-1]